MLCIPTFPVGRLDNADWWWQYGLDGIVGGVIGGAATGVAVWLTLRHERRQQRDDADRAEEAALRADVAKLHGIALKVFLQGSSSDEAQARAWAAADDLFVHLALVSAAAKRPSPALAADLTTAWGALSLMGKAGDYNRVRQFGKVLSVQLLDWMSDPAGYAGGTDWTSTQST